ncbi:hypothetical protein [Veronia pacifica]|uniref:Uncharacterized protein n=1 Tax=Veronia pacifica TaxID=1080227 RepID=A0A1C3EEM7_9GAMM|nr:hypothetical protein [Veronia pacifica]ODA31691.1 hypothetical protein A8L45_15720 [Veronia pacifica]
MNDWKKGFVLFSAMLSPLAMADWQVDIAFEFSRKGKTQSTETSVSLVPGEETLLFEVNSGRTLIGKAELIDVTADEVSIAMLIQEQLDDGAKRTIMSPVMKTGLNIPTSFDVSDSQSEEFASLKIQLTSV